MKKVTIVIFMLLLGGAGFVMAGDLTSLEVENGDNIWKISENLLLEAMMNASVVSIDKLKDEIVILNGMDSGLDDGIVTFNRMDPDYIVPDMILTVPDLLPDSDEYDHVVIAAVSVPEPAPLQPIQTTPVPEAPDDESFRNSIVSGDNGSEGVLNSTLVKLDNLLDELIGLNSEAAELRQVVEEADTGDEGLFEQLFNNEYFLVLIILLSSIAILVSVATIIKAKKQAS